MALLDDLINQFYGDAQYGSAETYEQLRDTWQDTRPLPSEEALAGAWLRLDKKQEREESEAENQVLSS